MKNTFLFLLGACNLIAAPAVQVLGVVPTHATIAVRGYSGSCTIQASTDPGFATVIPDVDATKYAGADTDISRPDMFTWSDGTRVVQIGHQNSDRALRVSTHYYVRVSGCGGTANVDFTTPTLGIGSSHVLPPPFNLSKWGNLDLPPINWTARNVHYTDPSTGVDLTMVNPYKDFTWRWNAENLADYAGGTGWTNPANILTGSASSYATTSGTNSIDVFPGALWWVGPYDQWPLDDVGLKVFGSGTSATQADRDFTVCIIRDPVDGCYSNPVTIHLPQFDGTNQAPWAPSGSSDPEGAWPKTFPTPLEGGDWGGAILRESDLSPTGHLNATNGALTITDPAAGSHFSTVLGAKSGYRIHIAGSSPTCANNLCTISQLTNALNATAVENVTGLSGAAYTAHGWGFRIQKVNSNGSINVGVQVKIAGSRGSLAEANPSSCSGKVVSGDGKPGFACPTWGAMTGEDSLYFYADDGTVRRMSDWTYAPNWNGWDSRDIPAGGPRATQSLKFGDSAGNFYVALQANSGSICLYKLTYTGNWTEDIDWNYNATVDGNPT